MSNSHRVGILDLVRASATDDDDSRSSVGKIFYRIGFAVMVADVACAVALLGDFQAWDSSDMLHSFALHNLVDGFFIGAAWPRALGGGAARPLLTPLHP